MFYNMFHKLILTDGNYKQIYLKSLLLISIILSLKKDELLRTI